MRKPMSMTGPHHFREDAGATHLDSALTTTDSYQVNSAQPAVLEAK